MGDTQLAEPADQERRVTRPSWPTLQPFCGQEFPLLRCVIVSTVWHVYPGHEGAERRVTREVLYRLS